MRRSSKGTLVPGAGVSAFVLFLVACATTAAIPQPPSGTSGPQAEDRPTLVVFLIVDQLRGDMLARYSHLFTGGFKRILEEGLNYSNALHAHAQTETSPGHATISTGVFPNRAGVPSNAWRERGEADFHPVYNVVDPGESLVGVPDLPGSSPKVLRRTGLADWVKEADRDARVVSVSAKDRAAVLMAGKAKGEVYWFESRAGRFVTSTFYRSDNPWWLRDYNERGLKEFEKDSVWTSIVPPEAATWSAPDTASFEGNGVHTYFPHRFRAEVTDPDPGDFFFWFEGTPLLDRATLDVALRAMEEEDLGKKAGRTDFLSISFSQTDRIGHGFGPLSREQMDNLLRLDLVLGDLFTALDREVGRGKYIVGFTSDHGVMDNPERIPGGGLRLTEAHRAELGEVLGAAARQAGMRSDLSTADAMLEALEPLDFVGPAYTQDFLGGSVGSDSLAALFQHSYTPGRYGGLLSTYGVEMWWEENVLAWGMPVGTTHGSPYRYDRWVPMALLGPGIEPGVVEEAVRPMDLAPTLAALAGIPFPDDLDGRPLLSRND